MIPPKKLKCPSDDNELEFIQIIKTKTEIDYEYKYTKSAAKTENIIISEVWLIKYLKDKIFVEINQN